jgi:hypothetical protein
MEDHDLGDRGPQAAIEAVRGGGLTEKLSRLDGREGSARDAPVGMNTSSCVAVAAIIGHAGRVAKSKPGASAPAPSIRVKVHVIGGAAGRVVAAAQGRAVWSLLAALPTAKTADQANTSDAVHAADPQTGHIYRNR